MNELNQLAIKYNTDKWGKHNYTPYYYDLFKDRRKQVKKVVEIGVGEGASLRMWQDFFPNAQIFGGEIDKNRLFEEDRIRVFKCDQTYIPDLEGLIKNTGSDIDLFIDDGDHKPAYQLFTCLVVMPLLSGDTTYVIEDVSDPAITQYLDDYDWQVIKVGKRYDDRLIVVRHQ